jgi:DNA-binding response OmpR family regulator
VDDSPTYREALAELLVQDGHNVALAPSGEEALELLAIELVDAIILDLLMPGIGGLETCRRLRSNPALRHIPVMMLTGRDDKEARAEGLASGVDEFVVKSPELELLKVRLRALLRKRRSEPDSRRGEDREPSSTSSGMWRRQDEVPRSSLLYRVITESGLSNVIGPTTIVRACKRVGIDARTMSPADLKRALPTIRETLRLFLTAEETEQRVQAIASLVKDA